MTAVDWSYVAGYFDGEGTAWCSKGKTRSRSRICLSWWNCNLESLEAIRACAGTGAIRVKKQQKPHHKKAYQLAISRRADVLRVAQAMLPFVIVKRDALLSVIEVAMQMSDESVGRGALAAAGAETIRSLYWTDGLDLAAIGDRFGVTRCAVKSYMKRHGIPRRNRTEISTGRSHSPETKARMSAIKRQQWRDPEIRARMIRGLATLSASRA